MTAPSRIQPLIVWLDRQQGDRSLVGGKGFSLSQLAHFGAPVPPAFALTTRAHDLVASALDVPSNVSAHDSGTLARMQAWLREEPLPPALSTALADAYATLRRRSGDVPLAVRSSAPAEDSTEASFAGVHDTFLDIRSLPDLEAAVRCCWASLWSERAVTYRQLRGMEARRPTIAVVVQQMIQSDVSFVVFTSDPVNARSDHLVISASWGLGEAIVSGQVNPDHIVVNPRGDIVEYVIGNKDIMIVPGAASTAGTREAPVPRAMRGLPSLTTAQVQDIARIARNLSGKLGFAADLEGAFWADQLYLFQARPITTHAAPAIAAPSQV